MATNGNHGTFPHSSVTKGDPRVADSVGVKRNAHISSDSGNSAIFRDGVKFETGDILDMFFPVVEEVVKKPVSPGEDDFPTLGGPVQPVAEPVAKPVSGWAAVASAGDNKTFAAKCEEAARRERIRRAIEKKEELQALNKKKRDKYSYSMYDSEDEDDWDSDAESCCSSDEEEDDWDSDEEDTYEVPDDWEAYCDGAW